MSNHHLAQQPQLPPEPEPIDKLWAILIQWGLRRTFEDKTEVVNVILKKAELDRVIRVCYGLGVKK